MKPEQRQFFQQAEKALQDAVERVIDEARCGQQPLVVWEDGAVRTVTPDQLPPARPLSRLPSPGEGGD